MLTDSQIKFGFERLDDYCNKFGLTRDQGARVLDGVQSCREFWDWINADEFLLRYLNGRLSDDAN